MTLRQPANPPEEPRVVLSRAATWIGRFGTILIIVGAVLAVYADRFSLSFPTLKMILAIVIWIVPGGIYLLTARALRNRKRWAISSADATTYSQIAVAGLMVLVALLAIKTLWPLIAIAAAWLVVLLQTPRRLVGLSEAMDQLASRVTDR